MSGGVKLSRGTAQGIFAYVKSAISNISGEPSGECKEEFR
jgi:hypothetical protein